MADERANRIDEIAAMWAAKADRGLSDEEAEALSKWLDSDERALGAYGRMRAVSLHAEKLRALGPSERRPKAPAQAMTKRRLLWIGAGAVAASAATGGYVAFERLWTAYSTRRGEIRSVALSDGSVVTLNTQTSIEVALRRNRRLIRLLQGEAIFEVAADRVRPFVVEAGEASIKALGTEFSVQRLPQSPILICVREGVVDVTARAPGAPERSAQASAGARVTVEGASNLLRTVNLDAKAIDLDLSWRQGRIAFQGETLEQAAREFARYSATSIIIDDHEIAQTPVVGLYQANDAVSFARTIATLLDLQVVIGENEVRLKRRPGA